MRTLLHRMLGSVTSIRADETIPAALMFAYSFLAHDVVQHSEADHAFAVHHVVGGGQPAVRAVRGRTADRRRHASVHQRHSSRAAPARRARHAGRGRRIARGLLGAAADRRRVGDGGVLLLRVDPGHSPDQPVLDPGERHLRRTAGEAAVRVHRRRSQSGRGARRRHDGGHRRGGGVGAARAGERGRAGRVRRHRGGSVARTRCRRSGRLQRVGAGCGRPRGVPPAVRIAAVAGPRIDGRLRRRRRRGRRAAVEHGGRRAARCGRRRQHCRLPRPDHRLPLGRRVHRPGCVRQPHPSVRGYRGRPASAADRLQPQRGDHPLHGCAMGRRRSPRDRLDDALHAGQDHA